MIKHARSCRWVKSPCVGPERCSETSVVSATGWLRLRLQGGGKDGRRCSVGLVCDTRQKHRAAPTRLLQKAKNKQEKVQNNTVGLQRGTPRLLTLGTVNRSVLSSPAVSGTAPRSLLPPEEGPRCSASPYLCSAGLQKELGTNSRGTAKPQKATSFREGYVSCSRYPTPASRKNSWVSFLP